MRIHKKFPIGLVLSLLAVTAAEARGPASRPWVIYPDKAVESCRAGTAPDHYAERCGELIAAYARALQSCTPPRSHAVSRVDAQEAYQACTKSAARSAAGQVK